MRLKNGRQFGSVLLGHKLNRYGLTDMAVNSCAQGCLAPRDAPARIAVSAGNVIYQEKHTGQEIYARYSFNRRFGPYQPALAASITDTGDVWAGAGAVFSKSFAAERLRVQTYFMPGLHVTGKGPKLGHALEFCSGVELAYQTPRGMTIGLGYDHRSNGDISAHNPGLDTLYVQFSFLVP